MIDPFKPYAEQQPWLPFSEMLLEWDEDFHQLMLCDHIRMLAYETAIRSVVKPGQIVVDLGTGTGILALWALQAGAEKVYGIDLDGNMIRLASERMHRHGYSDRFIPCHQLSHNVTLPQQADVLISEIIGNMGDNEDFQPILEDAMARLLKPGGSAIPSAVETFLVPVAAEKAHRDIAAGNVNSLNQHYQLQQLMAQKKIRNPFNLYYDTIVPMQLHLARPNRVKRYGGHWQQPPHYALDLEFAVHRQGMLTGFKGYFRARLANGVELDIGSGDIANRRCSDSWKHCFFPIQNPIPVLPGDTIQLCFERRSPHDQALFRQFYGWQGEVLRADRVMGHFRQDMEETAHAVASID